MAEITVSDPVPRLTMRGVRKRFGATVALDGVDLSIRPGEVHALVGENGTGKSTLMKTLSGAIRADDGAMSLDGVPYEPASPMDARRLGVAMIYQELSLCPHLYGRGYDILLGMEPGSPFRMGPPGRGHGKRAAEALAMLGHPEIDPAMPVGRLSIAAQQLVEIARAVAVGCRVLVLDEPTSSLTRADVEKLFAADPNSSGTKATRWSTSRISSRRCGASLAASPCYATAAEHVGGGGRHPPMPRWSGIVATDGWSAQESGSCYAPRGNPGTPGTPGECGSRETTQELAEAPQTRIREFHAPPRRGARASPASSGAGRNRDAPRHLPGSIRSSAARSAAVGVFSGAGPRLAHAAVVAGRRVCLSEDFAAKSEGLALTRTIGENLTLSKMPALIRPAALDAVSATLDHLDSLQIRCCARPAKPSAIFPAATNKKSRSPGCSTTASTCCSSTSRPVASTSPARPRFTGSSTAWWARQGPANPRRC